MTKDKENWDWNVDDSADPAEVESALRNVIGAGTHRRRVRRSAMGGGLAALVLSPAAG